MNAKKLAHAAALSIAYPTLAGLVWIPCFALGLFGPRLSVVSLYAAALVALAALLPLARRGPGRSRARATVALGALAALPLLVVGSGVSWDWAIVESHWVCGTPMIGVPFAMLFIAPPALWLGQAAAFGVLRWLPRWSRFGLTLAALAAVAFAASTLVRAAPRFAAVGPDEWVGSLPVVARLAEPSPGASARIGADVVLRFDCDEPYAPEAAPACRPVLCRPGGGCGEAPELYFSGSEVIALRDRGRGLYVVRDGDPGATLAAFGPDLAPRRIEPDDLGPTIGLPPSVLALGVFGILIAGLALGMRARAAIRACRIGGRPGRVVGDAIVFRDGRLPARGALLHELPDGPATARAAGRPAPPGYRDDGAGGWWARAGTVAEQREALSLEAMSWDCVALCAALLAIHPFWVL